MNGFARIGQGGGHIGNKTKIEHLRAVRYAIECGLTLIDTAEGYNFGISEEWIGEAVYGMRNRIFISTKVSPENLSYNNILQSVENSLRRLKTDYIDLYSVHWPNQKYGAEEIASAFIKLREQGKIINIGVCNYSLDRVKEFQKYVPNIFAIQNEYNLVDRSVEDDLLPYCQSNSKHLISYSPLDQGKLMQDGVLQKIAIKYNKTVAQIALSWLITKKNVVPIPESYSPRHIKENSEAVQISLSKEDIEFIEARSPIPMYIPVNSIRIVSDGRDNRNVYTTIDEAIQNSLNHVPSPLDLSNEIKKEISVKPIKVRKSKDPQYQYDLISGRVRYWAWVIAFKDKPIKAVILEE